jgi:peptidoglycan/LPS O-acetylase OafA/YrhL
MTKPNVAQEHLERPESQAIFHRIRTLATLYMIVNLATFGVICALHNRHDLVNDTVWTRGTILAATSLLLLAFTKGIARGSHKAFLRVRIISVILLVSVVALLVIPGLLPSWMKVEQGVCGLLLLGIVAAVNSRHNRSLFRA